MPNRPSTLLATIFRIVCVLSILSLAACVSPQATQSVIQVNLQADGSTRIVSLPPGTTVQNALAQSGVVLGSLDRTEPPLYTVLGDQDTLRVIRVQEEFSVKQEIIPYEHQVIHNETLREGETLLIQPGVNGTREITYRTLIEDGVQVSSQAFESETIQEAVPEVMMVGVQAPFAAQPISGKIAYLTGGNAWVMSASTSNRQPLVTTGDLDGRVFSLSPNGEWLLYSRQADEEDAGAINELWVVNTTDTSIKPIDLEIGNVIHFAGWVPNEPQSIVCSTVEPREVAPGWQANNDLQQITFSSSGFLREKTLVEANSGGIYGWWGSIFAFSPTGSRLAYARPDGIGLVDLETGELSHQIEMSPFQTRADWAWVPSLDWSPDETTLYLTQHAPGFGQLSAEESPFFDLSALSFLGAGPLPLAQQTGMFAYPAVSPVAAGIDYRIAFLRAIFPDQSDTSNYRLVVMDRDGSNQQEIFPAPGAPGLHPQQLVWSPEPTADGILSIAIIYQGNLWLVEETGLKAQQVTGDGLTTRIDWQ